MLAQVDWRQSNLFQKVIPSWWQYCGLLMSAEKDDWSSGRTIVSAEIAVEKKEKETRANLWRS